MRTPYAPLALPSLLVVALASGGCGDAPDFELDRDTAVGEAPADADDLFSILSRGGEVKLGLTDQTVYFRLSDEVLADVDADIQEDLAGKEGIGGRIASAVTGGVSRALRTRVSWDVDEIRDVRWEDDRLVFEFEDGSRKLRDMTVGDEELEDAFTEEDARAFVAAFDEVKRTR